MSASYFLEEYIMKKIAILRSLITSASCAGAGCLRALYEKDKAFAQQQERLVAQAGTGRDDEAVQGTDVSECGALFFAGAVKAAARTAGENKVL